MISENRDVLILTDKDLCSLDQKICCGTTLKGKPCKNKAFEKYNHCKIHYDKFRLEKPDECCICMEKLNSKIPLSCGHWMHRNCIIKWGKDKCPVCRTTIKLTNNERKKMRNKDNKKIIEEEDIILPPQLLEISNAIMRSFFDAIRDRFSIVVDMDDNFIVTPLLNENMNENIMFGSSEFA